MFPYGGGEFSFNYNLSKHCLEFIPGKFKSWAKSNILINNLRIGHTDTKIHKKMKKALFGKKRIKLIPLIEWRHQKKWQNIYIF